MRFKILIIGLSFAFLVPVGFLKADSVQIMGSMDPVTTSLLYGWAVNTANPSQTMSVQFYLDSPYNQAGVLLGTVTADQSRPGLAAALSMTGGDNHGLIYAIPSNYFDGKSHAVYGYVVGTNNQLVPMYNAPQNVTLQKTYDIHGQLDSVQDTVVGWAVDLSDPSSATPVEIYLDNPKNGGGVLVSSTIANINRLGFGAYFGISSDTHGFSYSISDTYLDGKAHKFYVYAGPVGNAILIGGGAQTIQLSCNQTRCPTTLPISGNDGHIKIETVGNLQTVFSYANSACAVGDIPDTATIAFRSADGQAHLVAGAPPYVYASVGASLDTVTRNCNSILSSSQNTQYGALDYYRWLSGTYTEDGITVYGLVHNEWYPQLVDSRCFPGSTVYSMAMAISTNGGKTFVQPSNYRVKWPTTSWSTSFPCSSGSPTVYGYSGSSNIIKKDGYYYAFFSALPDPSGSINHAQCVMRTQDLSNASAWQVWTGNASWGSAQQIAKCNPVETYGVEIQYVSYNTYLGKYIAILAAPLTPQVSGTDDLWYAVSTDLLNWSVVQKILTNTIPPQMTLYYAAFIDPTDTSRNFERSGQDPYIYMTLDHGGANRDLVRQKIHLTNLDSAPVIVPAIVPVTSTASQDSSASSGVGGSSTVPPVTTGSAGSSAGSAGASVSASAPSQSSPVSGIAFSGIGGGSGGSVLPVDNAGTASISNSPARDKASAVSQTTAACPVIARTLTIASEGSDVLSLQAYLIAQGLLSSDSATGYFGARTSSALSTWQSAHGIVSSGSSETTGYGAVGPRTRTALSNCSSVQATSAATSTMSTAAPAASASINCPVILRTLSLGSTGSDVSILQTYLTNIYSNFTSVTGYYGSITESAVKQWQSLHGIVSSGSPAASGWGVVGSKTRAAFLQCSN